MKKSWKKLLAIVITSVMISGAGGFASAEHVSAGSGETINVTLHFDCSSLGSEEALKVVGFDPDMADITVEILKNGTVWDAIQEAAEEEQGNIVKDDNNKYISSAYGLGNGLAGVADKLGFEPVPTSPYNYTWAGWIFSVNGQQSISGAADHVLTEDSDIDFRYQLAYKEGGAYDWDFVDAYRELEDALQKAETIDRSSFTEVQLSAVDEAKEQAEKIKNEIDEESGGFWASYFIDKGTALWGPGSPTQNMVDAAKNLSYALDKKAAPQKIVVEDTGKIYVGKKAKISYEVKPEGASQEVTYEVIEIGGEAEVSEDGYITGRKPGKVAVRLISKEDSSVSCSTIITVEDLPESVKTADEIYDETTSYISSHMAPDYDDWYAVGLARSGNMTDQQKTEYYKKTVKYLEQNENDRMYATDYARIIIGLTAAGWDVTDVDGRNLLDALSDMEFATQSGINAAAYTLIAYDSHDYDIPDARKRNVQTTREGLIEYLLGKQKENGGWNWDDMSSDADVDMTAMVLQSLAPYYNSDKEVKDACDKAVVVLSEKQAGNGTYISWGVESASSIAEVIVALTSLDIDPGSDSRFVKNGKSLIDGLNSLAAEGGGYVYGEGEAANDYSTKQGYYGMVSYYRYLAGENSLYDMSDVIINDNPDITADTGSGEGSGDKTGQEYGNHSGKDGSAATGDDFDAGLWGVFAMASAAAAVTAASVKRRRSR